MTLKEKVERLATLRLAIRRDHTDLAAYEESKTLRRMLFQTLQPYLNTMATLRRGTSTDVEIRELRTHKQSVEVRTTNGWTGRERYDIRYDWIEGAAQTTWRQAFIARELRRKHVPRGIQEAASELDCLL